MAVVGPAAGALTEVVGPTTYAGGSGLGASAPAGRPTSSPCRSVARPGRHARRRSRCRPAGPARSGPLTGSSSAARPPPLANGIVGPHAVSAADAAYVTYGANGFAPAAYTSNDLASSTATDLVDSAGGAAPAASTAYALRLGTTALTGGPVTLAGGGLILNNGTTAVAHSTNLVFGSAAAPGQAYVYADNADVLGASGGAQTASLTGLLTASELVKFGPGTLRLSNVGQRASAGLANAVVTVNGGTLEIGERTGTLNDARALPNTASVVAQRRGGQLLRGPDAGRPAERPRSPPSGSAAATPTGRPRS